MGILPMMYITNYEESSMAGYRLENPTTAEVLTNYETRHAVDPDLQRQLGRISLDGLTLANPVETHPYSELEAELKHSIIGQDEAIDGIMSALSREKFRNPNRPIANLLFLGPTGVGKSETAKKLADLLHDGDESAFLKIDCSMFALGHTIGALTGAPPAYVGREQPPILDRAIIEKEKSIVLFDEIEKGSQPLHDLMLQIMYDGELTLTGTGEKVSFRNSIIIMTTNLGANEMMGLLDPAKTGFQSQKTDKNTATKQQIDKAANGALKHHFRPEFINRIDQRVVFDPLTDVHLGQVLDNYVENANERYRDYGVSLEISNDVKQKIITSSEERRQFGARPILRAYDRMIESILSKHVSTGVIPEGSDVVAVLARRAANGQREYEENIDFYFRPNEELMPKPVTKEVVFVVSETGIHEGESRVA